MSKVLILGAKGNLGSQLARTLGNDHQLVLWDRDEIDITEQEELKEKIIEHKPDIIINTVAYNAVDKCEEDEGYNMAIKLNRDAVGALADIALELGSVLVQYVSDYVFPGDSKDGYKEDALTKAINKYGKTKVMTEDEIKERVNQGLKYYLIRTSKLFGPQGESELAKPSFFDTMLKLSKEKDELKVVDEEMSCFTYTPDLAKATKELFEEKKEFGIYHIINEGPCTWHEATVELFKIAKKNTKVIPVSSDEFPRPAKRPKYSVLINTKLPKLRNYKDALKEYLTL